MTTIEWNDFDSHALSGVGEALVLRGVEDARAEGRKIVPLCPFAKAQIDRYPEWQDVLQRKS